MFKADDRVRETSVTVGGGTYTLAGAPAGFQAFSSLGANAYVPYFSTDDVNWETGIGQVLTAPDRLSRITILASSNADAAVNWGATTKKIRCGMPALMAFPRTLSKDVNGAGTVVLDQNEQRRDILIFTGALTGDRVIEVDADTPWRWAAIINNTTGLFKLTVRATGQTGAEFYQGRATPAVHDGTDVKKACDDVPPGAYEDYGGGTVQVGRLKCDGSNVSRATYPALTQKLMKSAVVTFTNGTDRVNWAAHGLGEGDVFKFTTTGAAPAGLTAGTTYFVINPTANDFQVAATEGGAAINFTDDGTGVHTGIHAPHGDGDGSTTVTLPDFRRRVAVGSGGTGTAQLRKAVGATGGAESRPIGTTNLPASGLSIPSLSVTVRGGNTGTGVSDSGVSANVNGLDQIITGSTSTGTTGNMGSGNAFDEMQPGLVVLKTIRT
jgi:microcystin-dependent protein